MSMRRGLSFLLWSDYLLDLLYCPYILAGQRREFEMGYTIVIGEAIFDGDKSEAYMKVWAEGQSHDDAPTFPNDEMTGNSNMRSPSYTGWSEFCRDSGLYGMFFGIDGRRDPYMKADENCHRETPIMSDHPGFAVINDEDVLAIKQALERHKMKYGELEPGFRGWLEKEEDAPPNATACATRARLLWLHYWTDWAVKNCKWPVIVNS